MRRRCLIETLKQFPRWTSPLAWSRFSTGSSESELIRTFATETSVIDTAVDARALVGNYQPQQQIPSTESQSREIVGYRPRVPRSFVGPGYQNRGPRRVSEIVMRLQLKMHELLMGRKFQDAVKVFEDFVNEAFKEARENNLPLGMIPIAKRPVEAQWKLYIDALDGSQRIATSQISSAIAIMKQIGLQPRNAHYYVLLQNIRAQGDSVRACKVIDEMIKNGIRPAPRCYEQAIFTCLSMRDLNSTSMLLNNLYSSTSFSMNQARYALMLYTNVVIFCSNLKNIENALLFMKQMTDLQLIVPVHLRLDVACSAAEVNDSAAVEVILREFENLRTKIRMEAEKETSQKDEQPKVEVEEEQSEDDDLDAEDHDKGHHIFKTESGEDNWRELLHQFLLNDPPMASSYHAFIEAQAKAGNVERAFEAVLELERNYPENAADLSPAQGLSMFVDELAHDASTVDQAYLVLDAWHKEGKKVTEVMLDVIVSACSRMGDVNRAFETFEVYPKLGLQHRTESYNALMEVCARQNQVEVIMKLLQQMAKAGVRPNVDTYMEIIEGYINNGDTKGIAHALNITIREGFRPTLRILERAQQCAEKYNDQQALHLIRREMLALGKRNLQLRTGVRGRGRGRGSYGPGRGAFVRADDPNYGGPAVRTYVGRKPPESQTESANATVNAEQAST